MREMLWVPLVQAWAWVAANPSDVLLWTSAAVGTMAVSSFVYWALSVAVDGAERLWRWLRSRGPVFADDDDPVTVLRQQMGTGTRPPWVASPDTRGSAVLQPMTEPRGPWPTVAIEPTQILVRAVTPPPRRMAIEALAGEDATATRETALRPAAPAPQQQETAVVPVSRLSRWWFRRTDRHEGATLTSKSPKTADHEATPDYTPPEQLSANRSVVLEPYGVIGATWLPPIESIYDDVHKSPVWKPIEDLVTDFGKRIDLIIAELLKDETAETIHVEIACAHERTEEIDAHAIKALLAVPTLVGVGS